MGKAAQNTDDRKAAAAAGNDRGEFERTPFGRRRVASKFKLRTVPKYVIGLIFTSAIFVCRRFGFAKPIPKQ
jgi:hypothetical protein